MTSVSKSGSPRSESYPGHTSRHLDLSEKTLGGHRLGELWQENLDRDLAVVLKVESQVHRRHAAMADLLIDSIAIGESGAYLVEEIVH